MVTAAALFSVPVSTTDPPSAHAVAAAALPADRLEALLKQVQGERSDPTLSLVQHRYVDSLLEPIAVAISDELAERQAVIQ